VQKVAKAILIAAGALLAIGAVAVLGVNLYIQSAATQERIQRALGRALRMPVKITTTSFTPWRGLRLDGIAAQDVNSADGENFLEISEVSARIRLWKLLRREVSIRELTIESPKVSWMQNPGGKWRFPQKNGEPPEEASTTPAVENPAPAESPMQTPEQTPAQTAAAPEPEAAPAVRPPRITVDSFHLNDGTFDLLDHRHKRIAAVTGLNVQSQSPTAEAVRGKASVERVMIQELFALEDWSSDFDCSKAGLTLSNSRATFGGGTATGALNVKTAEPYSPFNFDVNFSDVDIARLVAEAHLAAVQASGTLSGFLKLQGNMHDSGAAAGSGQLVLANGRIGQVDFLKIIGQLLQIDELTQLDLQQAQVDYRIAAGNVLVDKLLLKTQNLTLTSQGVIALAGGAIFLKTRLEIGGNISKRLPDIILQNFVQSTTPGSVYLDFDVTGTLESPKTNLLKLLGKNLDIKHPGNLLKSLFGSKPKPTAAPAATPAVEPVVTPQ
jgi:type II secretion system protein N